METLKVKFELPTTAREVDTLIDFLTPQEGGLDWSNMVYNQHPKLREILKGIKDKGEFYDQCYKYVDSFIKENKKILEETRESFQKSWKETEGKFLVNLLKDFETDYPKEIKEIKASVSINPICPRYLDEWSFNVFYKFSDDRMRQTCIHEIIHFFYFKKWLEVFPDYDKKHFDNPYPEWVLSEILVSSIINNNKTIQKIIKNHKTNVYKEWQSIMIGKNTLSGYFGELYKEHLEEGTSFADFLKKSWEEYNKHKDIIECVV